MLYATYSEGFRSGGGNAVRSNSVLPRGFDSDFLTNYELGSKNSLLDGALQVNAVAYHMVWEDIQVSVEDPQPQVYALGIVNFPEAEIDGIEVDFQWLPAEGWELSGTGAWLDAKLSKTSTQYGVTAVEGSQLPLAPEWKGSLGAQYSFPAIIWGGEPYVRVDYSYNGNSLNSLGGLESLIVSPPPDKQAAYSLLDFTVGLEAEGWSAQFFVDNVTDERAEQFYSNRWGKKRLSINDPRSFGISVRRNF
jgi:outer membrane receptor protein involved in Fe transport